MSRACLWLLAGVIVACRVESKPAGDDIERGGGGAGGAAPEITVSGNNGAGGAHVPSGAGAGAGAGATPSVVAGAPATPACAAFTGDIAAGRTLLCIGQDTGEIEAYDAALGAASCVMLYTNVADLAGFDAEVDFGTGRQSLKHWVSKPEPLALQLAVSLLRAQGGDSCAGDHLGSINDRSLDGAISSMAIELAATQRPIYLRFGYEFDNSACHVYEPNAYRDAFRHFSDVLRTLGAANVKLVWNAWGGKPLDVSAWYPGDDVVDYVAVSYFPIGIEPAKLENMAKFALAHGKPLMIAESTPQAQNPLSSTTSWRWFDDLFGFVAKHDVRVLSYINQNWNAQSVWAAQGIWGDSRVQGSALEANWRSAIAQPRFLTVSSELYRGLGCQQ